MKKTSLLLFVCLAFSVAVQAQEFKKFKVAVGGGYASPAGKGAKGGVLFYIEPAYRIQDNISVGLRMEQALVVRGFSEDVPSGIDLNIAGIGSYTLNGQYYFNNNNFRPFVGAGFGLYSLAAVKYDSNGQTDVQAVASGSKVGFYPRVGFDLNHFNVSIDYNIIGATKVAGGDGEFKNSYLGVRIGGSFGGGRK